MSRIYLYLGILCIFFLSLKSYATIHNVNAEDFEFSPSSLNVTVGDTIRWTWDNSGSAHTTTSTSVPSGAPAWDAPVDVSHQVFDYKVTVPGVYAYKCSVHLAMGMVGSFTASGSASVNNYFEDPYFILNTYSVNDELHITINLKTPDPIQIQLYDMKGALVKELSNTTQPAGVYSESYAVNDIVKGIYLLKAKTRSNWAVRKIVIE